MPYTATTEITATFRMFFQFSDIRFYSDQLSVDKTAPGFPRDVLRGSVLTVMPRDEKGPPGFPQDLVQQFRKFGIAVDLGATIVRAVVAVFAGLARAVVVAGGRVTRVRAFVAGCATGAGIAAGLARATYARFGAGAELSVVTFPII